MQLLGNRLSIGLLCSIFIESFYNVENSNSVCAQESQKIFKYLYFMLQFA